MRWVEAKKPEACWLSRLGKLTEVLPEQLNRLTMDLQRLLSRLFCQFVGWGDRVDVCPSGHLIDRSAELVILYRSSDDHQTIGEAANRRHRWVVAGEGSIPHRLAEWPRSGQ